jgi:4-aminobutyrate aminotransferase/(S)-3-amino-2-methylpropionate transaminase
MGPGRGLLPPGLVYTRAFGSNVFDADDNRYVDLAAGFGAILLGHCHPELTRCIADQASRLTQALGDVFPSTEKIVLQEMLAQVMGPGPYRVILGQSGADAVTAALKTAALATGLPGVIAFSGAYHGLSYAPLSLCGLRSSYKAPFAAQLNPHIHNLPYPSNADEAHQSLSEVARLLAQGTVGAVVIEPILGRGGCVIPPEGFLSNLIELTRKHRTVSIFDEIWTGLGRCGSLLYGRAIGAVPDIVCLGKGLGGGLPLSACIGHADVMQAWQRDDEVVHTSTFAGTPLATAAATCLLRILEHDGIIEQTLRRGELWIDALRERLSSLPSVREIRGRGFMVGIDLGPRPGMAAKAASRLLSNGWITSTGGGLREVLILTPPLTISDQLLSSATSALHQSLSELGA